MIIPSIDIQGGKAVQLRQGRDLVLTDPRDPVELATEFARFGPVAVVDLDAALGRGENREVMAACCRAARCRVGGGIRTKEDVRHWIRRGAEKVVIGTMASPDFLRSFPPEWIVVALDARNNHVVIRGWTEDTELSVLSQARTLAPYCGEFLFTQVEREGMLGGCDLETAAALRAAVDVPITVAGGIHTIDEIRLLEDRGCNSQIGRAVYEGKLDLCDAWTSVVNFDKQGLVPTIVQGTRSGDVLMLAYSNTGSLRKALATGEGWYYSRSRGRLWRKGETSGHVQKLVAALWDCDRDTVLFRVEQTGPACHRNAPTCFGDRSTDVLNRLETTLLARQSAPSDSSYTRELLDDPELVAAKLREEVGEVIDARSKSDTAWESADVLYHLMVRMLAGGIRMDDVRAELRSRFMAER